MQSFARALIYTRTVRSGGTIQTGSRETLCVRTQSDYVTRACADGPDNWQSHHGSESLYPNDGVATVQMAAESSLQSGPSWLQKHFEFSVTRSMGLRAEDSCRIQADHSISVDGLPVRPAISAGRLHNRLFKSTFSFWHQMHPCLDYAWRRDHVKLQTVAQNSQGYSSSCNTSIFACDSMEMPNLRTKEKSGGEDEGDPAHVPDDGHNSVCIAAVKNDLLTMDDLADKLFSAITDLDSVDMQQVCLQLRLRYRRTPSETFMSDLQKKVELFKLQSPTLPFSKTLFKKRHFLFASAEDVQAVLEVLKDFFGSGEKACSILVRSSSLITKPLEGLQGMLKVIVEFQIEKQAVEKSSEFLTCDTDRVWRIFTFLRSWGVHDASMSRMIKRDWRFLQWTDKEQAQAAVTFLQSTGMSKLEILDLLSKRPDVLCRPIDKNLTAKLKLCQQWGLNFGSVIGHITYHSHERTLSQIEFFKEHGFSNEAVVQLIEREPRVLGKSREDLKLKLDYLLCTHKRDITEIIKFPACLCYSYKLRIVPRLKFLQKKGVLGSFCLSYMLAIKGSHFRTVFKVPESVKLI